MLGGSIALFFSPITFSPLFFGSYKEKASTEIRKSHPFHIGEQTLPEEVFCSSRGHLCSVSMALKCPREELFRASPNTF